MRPVLVVALVVTTLLPSTASATPPKVAELPPALRDWAAWVLHDEPQATCPFFHVTGAKGCDWPGRLTLALDEKGGHFTQAFRVYSEAWLALPGDLKHWPQAVQVDGRPAVVAPRNEGTPAGERPTVKLSPGEHAVSGDFAWTPCPKRCRYRAPPGCWR